MRKRFCPPGTMPYIIRPGDTFAAIARQFNISMADLRIYNYAMNHNFLIPGETLCVPINIYRQPYHPMRPPYPQRPPAQPKPPVKPGLPNYNYMSIPVMAPLETENKDLPFTVSAENDKVETVCENGSPYVIQRGDTLIGIAKKHNVFLQDLLDSNPMLNPQYYLAGQTICIPKGELKGDNVYIITRGDSLRRIADKTRFSTRALRIYNPEVNWAQLRVGQKIYVPRV